MTTSSEGNRSLFKGRNLTIILHLVIWLVVFILPTYLLYLDSRNDTTFLYSSLIQTLLFAIVFYANYLWLTPRLFLKKKLVLYFLASFMMLAASTYISNTTFTRMHNESHMSPDGKVFRPGIQPPIVPFHPPDIKMMEKKRPSKNWPIYNFIITTLFISGFGMGLCYSDKFREQEKSRKEAEKEKLQTELAFLKNQINPHFFFNTLNNIYSLVQTSVGEGQKAILQLSKLMRYLLYETEKGDKLLSHEIEFMKTYIELMKLRISEKVTITEKFPEQFHDVSLPPLLFLPFIENAFKHGISYRRPSFIYISLDSTQEGIVFTCRNSIGNKSENIPNSDSGIGLENVRKRLMLLFPDTHQLLVTETEDSYEIQLKIDSLRRQQA